MPDEGRKWLSIKEIGIFMAAVDECLQYPGEQLFEFTTFQFGAFTEATIS